MISAPKPEDEAARLATLLRFSILDTLPEPVYDDVVQLAARICDVPIALISLVDSDRQWFKARVGLDATETPRELAFCAHAILGDGVLEVTDASADERFHDNPLVAGAPDIRYYAGAPIVARNGHPLGTVCVIDRKARGLTPEQLAALEALSRQVVSHLELREQLQTGEELATTLRRMSHLLEESQRMARVGGWSLDLRTEELSWTEETYRIHETSPAIYRPTVESAVGFYTPDSLPIIQQTLEEAKTAGRPFEVEVELTTAKGRRIWVQSAGKPVFEDGSPVQIVGAFQDITERRQAAEELRAAKETAEKASRAKSDFLATMSHEIRTPMNAVLGYASLLEETPLDVTQRDYLGVVERSGQALLGLIDDILDYAKIEAGMMDVEQIAFDLHTTIEDVVRMLLPKAGDKGVVLETDIAAGVPRCIAGDPGRLGQVLLNLTSNAVKFTNDGTVVVGATVTGRDSLRIEVTDTGIGIAADRIGKLFQEFSQADSSTCRRFGGTGLGLAISRRIVELMEGRIGVHSTAGKGSTFWLELPLLAADPEHAISEATTGGSLAASGRVRVLLVEDHPVNQHLAREFLKSLNCEVDLASNGVEAVQLATRAGADYSLILMDCLMPEMDGYAATREIREREEESGRRVPIVAVTANAQAEDRNRCVACGMDDYLGKPFRKADLERILTQWARPGEAVTPPAS